MAKKHDTRTVSIAGYHMRNFKEGENSRGGVWYTGEVWHKDTCLGFVEEQGNGGAVKVTRDSSNGFTRNDWERVSWDLKNVYTLLGDNLSPESVLYPGNMDYDYDSPVDHAIKSWLDLLIELNEFSEYANRVANKVNPQSHYIIAGIGGSVVKDYIPEGKLSAAEIKNPANIKRIIQATSGHTTPDLVSPDRRMYALAILQGAMDWALSAEQYASLYNPYSYLEEY